MKYLLSVCDLKRYVSRESQEPPNQDLGVSTVLSSYEFRDYILPHHKVYWIHVRECMKVSRDLTIFWIMLHLLCIHR